MFCATYVNILNCLFPVPHEHLQMPSSSMCWNFNLWPISFSTIEKTTANTCSYALISISSLNVCEKGRAKIGVNNQCNQLWQPSENSQTYYYFCCNVRQMHLSPIPWWRLEHVWRLHQFRNFLVVLKLP